VDDVTRFRGAHHVEAYLGLVPSEWSSSEVQRRGHITKAGNGRMRGLLVQAAWGILRRRKRLEPVALRDWAEGIAGRRGRAIAAVALARRLAGILFAMWRDGTVYDATNVRGPLTARRAA
jgi:transposase